MLRLKHSKNHEYESLNFNCITNERISGSKFSIQLRVISLSSS
jgi:hypothetical protein